VFLEATTIKDIPPQSRNENTLQRLGRGLLEKIAPPDPNAESQHIHSTVSELRLAPPFPCIPLIVVIGGKPPMAWIRARHVLAARAEHQRELVHLSPLGKQVSAARSGHFPQFTEPELVVAVVEEAANSSFQRNAPWRALNSTVPS
jgi:hypothetical protein